MSVQYLPAARQTTSCHRHLPFTCQPSTCCHHCKHFSICKGWWHSSGKLNGHCSHFTSLFHLLAISVRRRRKKRRKRRGCRYSVPNSSRYSHLTSCKSKETLGTATTPPESNLSVPPQSPHSLQCIHHKPTSHHSSKHISHFYRQSLGSSSDCRPTSQPHSCKTLQPFHE